MRSVVDTLASGVPYQPFSHFLAFAATQAPSVGASRTSTVAPPPLIRMDATGYTPIAALSAARDRTAPAT